MYSKCCKYSKLEKNLLRNRGKMWTSLVIDRVLSPFPPPPPPYPNSLFREKSATWSLVHSYIKKTSFTGSASTLVQTQWGRDCPVLCVHRWATKLGQAGVGLGRAGLARDRLVWVGAAFEPIWPKWVCYTCFWIGTSWLGLMLCSDGDASEDLGQKRLILVGSGIGAGLDILLMGWA